MINEELLNGETITIRTSPQPRSPLPRFSNNMAKDKWNHSPESQSSSQSPNTLNLTEYSRNDCNSTTSSRYSHSTPSPVHRRGRKNSDNSNQESKSSENEEVTQAGERNLRNRAIKQVSSLNSNESSSWKLPLTFFFIIISTSICFIFVNPELKDSLKNFNEGLREKKILREEWRRLKEEFKKQEARTWDEILFGIEEVILNPSKPCIFLLFADNNDPMSCLASTIGELGRIAFGSERCLIYKPEQMQKDTGSTIDELRSKSSNQSVIFWDLLGVNDEALKAFHHLFDRENPLVEKAIYIVTLKTESYGESQNPLEFVEFQLKSNFTGRIHEDALMPLITRITDGPVISVKPETITHCPVRDSCLILSFY